MGKFGEFDGREVLVATLAVGGFKIPLEAVIHQGDEILLLVRVVAGEAKFPPTDTATRIQGAKVVADEHRVMAALAPELRVAEWAQLLADLVDSRDGVQRLQSDGPDWLNGDPGVTEPVEMGDGPAKAKRKRTKPKADEPAVEDLPVPLGDGQPEGEDLGDLDAEWEAMNGSPPPEDAPPEETPDAG